jgi:hypothetical protein
MRIYCDTSVYGGCFDDEFRIWSENLWIDITAGKYRLLLSDIVVAELEQAPGSVRAVIKRVPEKHLELIALDDESKALAAAYISEGIVSRTFFMDCQHIAIATVKMADVLVSWNFKHIVNFNRIRLYNAVNLKHGYRMLDIRSPREMTQ